ncbi:MAG: metallophosphoesterase [Candidatus Cloacimonetes bacterium]|nr:metallophosphoesterase [Candidatus Cloacimonadota bacterium]
MKLVFLLIFTAVSGWLTAAGSLATSFSDGPFLFWENEQPVAYYIRNDAVIKNVMQQAPDGRYYLYWAEDKAEPVEIITEFPAYQTSYSLPPKFLALSDLHGNLDGTLELLRAGGVIDLNYNWSYDGWLIIDGDILDRGEDTTKILWLLFHLWQQAEESGNGKVIPLLGNHETMSLREKEHKMEGKYALTCGLMSKTYNELYGTDSFIGQWMRSWQTVLILEKYLFVHGGVSPGLAEKYPDIDEVNQMITTHYQGIEVEKIDYLFSNNGPFWYRGYFYDEKKWELSTPEIMNKILGTYELETIIVGHTTHAQIQITSNQQVIAIDAGLKYQESGQALLFKDKKFFVLASSGRISELSSE